MTNQFKLDIINQSGAAVEKIELPEAIFGAKPNPYLLHEVVKMYQANKRRGTASTKTRAEVDGSGRKPWRQKGTGRARAGSIRSPIWRKGGVVFGPHPRDFSYTMPRKKIKLALKQALSDKLTNGEIAVIDKIELATPKTKEMAGILKGLKIKGSVAIVFDNIDEKIKRAARNIPYLAVVASKDLNAYDVLLYDKLIFTKAAIPLLEARFKNGSA
jgi:large subunit ribosomal protein L4